MTLGAWRRWLAGLAVLLAAGCGPPSPEESARRAAIEECKKSIEVFVKGTPPSRPYRILGPVNARYGFVPMDAKRWDWLKSDACKLGAQAVIEVEEHLEDSETGGPDAPVTTGLAVVFTDAPAASAPAP